MDLLNGNVKKIYFKYLMAAFGSALISSIYGVVDMAIVGQYQGPDGTAALAVVAPIWNIIYSLGLLTGIGGSVLLSSEKGKGNKKGQNEYFTAALIFTVILAAVSWMGIALFDTELLTLFGAEETLLPLAKKYLFPVKFAVPLFLMNQMLAAFLRNDDAPALATKAVLSGGIFNVFGDYFFVFTLDMGIMGAGLATSMGAFVTCVIMLTHFAGRKNTLRIAPVSRTFFKMKQIAVVGFSTFFIDVAMGFLTMLFNRQIVKYLGTDALAVYGVIVNISTIVQCCAYSVGQAAQPIFSINYGAGKGDRIKSTLRYSLYAAGFFGIVWTVLVCAFPNGFIRIFMDGTKHIYEIAPMIMRRYGISFLLLPFNIFSTYYFQSLMRPKSSFFVSVARGMVISGILIMTLPAIAGANAIWFAMPVTEAMVAVSVVILMKKERGRDR
ncbi:MAG: MATE family efflux transporter [Lachnospiraceae bacterium]|nr:MATE family efflux transporter [Lachnospiraceae bacterium]